MPSPKNPNDPIVMELGAIKRLLVLQLLRDGATQSDIAVALQTDQGTVSRLIPAKKLSTAKK